MGHDQEPLKISFHGAASYAMIHKLVHMLLTEKPIETVNFDHILDQFLKAYFNPSLKPDQIEAAVRETPFADLARLLPKERSELYTFIALVLAVVQLIVSLHTPSCPTITPYQVEEIIGRVMDRGEHHPSPLLPPPLSNHPGSSFYTNEKPVLIATGGFLRIR